MPQRPLNGFEAKNDLIGRFAANVSVLHMGAVGETCEDTEVRVARAGDSLHAFLTRVASACVGVDHDGPSVRLLTERGVFDNLICADVTKISRDEIPLPAIDVIVAGDTIEHLAEPGQMFKVARALSDPHTRLLVTTPNSLGMSIFLKNVRGRELEGADHVCSFNAFTLGNLIERCGYQVDEMWTCYQPQAADRNPTTFRAGQALFRRVPRLGGTLLAVCSPRPIRR